MLPFIATTAVSIATAAEASACTRAIQEKCHYRCAGSFAAIQLMWWYFQNRLTNELGMRPVASQPGNGQGIPCAMQLVICLLPTRRMAPWNTLPSNAQGMGELDLLRMFDGMPRVIRDESYATGD